MPLSRVIVLGSVNVDLVVKTPSLPKPGETVLGGEFYRAAGGKGANQAVAAARISNSPVTLVAAIGDDDFGRESQKLLQQENLDCQYLKTVSNQSTGVALILVDEEGENVIGVASGANLELLPEDVHAVDETTFENAAVFLSCLESPLETVLAGLQRACEADLQTILNPAPASAEIVVSDMLNFVDLLTPNESEAALLTGIDTSTASGCIEAAKQLQQLGCAKVVVTRGNEGCIVVDEGEAIFVEAHSVTAIDATAAGDTFNGALASLLAEGKTVEEAVKWANAAAAISVTRRGAQPSIPLRAEIETFLA